MTSQSQRPRVGLFVTCLVDLFRPSVGFAAVRLLEAAGCDVFVPAAQTCCGQPAYNSGYWQEAREVAREQIRLFPEPWPIVVPSGSCAGMMKRHYPALFEGDAAHEDALAFASRVVELTRFLCDVLEVALVDRGEKIRVTWHSSCHALREAGVEEEPRRLLAQLSNVELVPLARERECCGFGGTFAVRQPEISAAMVEDKAQDASSTGAATLLSGDAGCLLNIGGRLEATGSAVRPCHVAQFLWERTNER